MIRKRWRGQSVPVPGTTSPFAVPTWSPIQTDASSTVYDEMLNARDAVWDFWETERAKPTILSTHKPKKNPEIKSYKSALY